MVKHIAGLIVLIVVAVGLFIASVPVSSRVQLWTTWS